MNYQNDYFLHLLRQSGEVFESYRLPKGQPVIVNRYANTEIGRSEYEYTVTAGTIGNRKRGQQ